MSEDIFVAAPFYLIRMACWPENILVASPLENPLDTSLEIYFESEYLREAIAIASPDLHSALKKISPKSFDQAKSLSRYISRMAMRPTPFGLFSSVSMAKWGEATNISFDKQCLRKQTRFDMEWVYLLIEKLYQDEKKFLSLPVRTNPLLQLSGERYCLNYLRSPKYTEKSVSVRFTPLIQLIFGYAKESISVDQLCLKLQASLPILERERTLDVLRQLFSQQFLLPGILPTLLNPSFFDTLLPHLSLFPGFETILEETSNYNQIPPGKGEKVLENLREKMAALIPNKSYLQVDTAYDGKNFALSKNVLEELNKALGLLWKIASVQKSTTTLTTYHSKFLEKYGTYRTVPLLELLDEQRGLGPLFENSGSLSSDSNHEWEKWLNQQWQNCLFHSKKEWTLTEECIDKFLMLSKQNFAHPMDAPLSFDLYCKIYANSPQNIDLGKFLIALGDITKEGGGIFGRFLDLLGSDAQAKVAQFFSLEERLEKESIFVELSYFPKLVRGANVTIRPYLRSHCLDLEGRCSQKGALALEDIYVGATSSSFYLTDKESQCNIITRTNHLVDIFYDPLPFKFMRYVTYSQYRSLLPFSWGPLQKTAVFLPRVRFNKTILSLAKWNIDPLPYLKESLEKNISTFNAWATQWDLPESFFIVQGDQHLLLHRTNLGHIQEIVNKLKKGESLTFIEKLEGAWVEGAEGKHNCEICIPFIKNAVYARKENPVKVAPYSPYMNENKDMFPGSNWLYLKLYMGEEKNNEFLIQYLYNFLENFTQEGTVKKWFIVRYQDPGAHLRLRVHFESVDKISKVLVAFEEQFRLWTRLGWIKDVAIAKYEREMERYGGSDLIEAAENVFYYDTLSALFIIHSFLTKQMDCEEVVLYALSIINFLGHFGLNYDEILSLLNTGDESELKGFRQHKNQLMTLIKAMQEGRSEIPEIQVMKVAFQMRRDSIETYHNLAADLGKEQWNSIIQSLLHMHCNRLGCIGKGELKAKLYARQALRSISQSTKLSVNNKIEQSLDEEM